MTHEERVALYVDIIETKCPKPITEFMVGMMRAKAPNQPALSALNEALEKLGWVK